MHDEKAYLMGGVAGHAGVFGTAADVAWLAGQYLDAVCWRERANCRRNSRANPISANKPADPILRRGLGWALKTSDENSCGRLFGMVNFGHRLPSGTCVW